MTPTSRRPSGRAHRPACSLLLLALIPRAVVGNTVEAGHVPASSDLMMSARDPFEVVAAHAGAKGAAPAKVVANATNDKPAAAAAADGAKGNKTEHKPPAGNKTEQKPLLSFSEAVQDAVGGAPVGDGAAARATLEKGSDVKLATAPAADKPVLKVQKDEAKSGDPAEKASKKAKPQTPTQLEQSSAALAAAGAAAAAATVPGSSAWLQSVMDPVAVRNDTCLQYGCGGFEKGRACQCNDKCVGYKNCCSDFENQCIKTDKVHRCFYDDIAFSPLDLPGTYGVVTANASACQAHCRRHIGCLFITFWSGLCHLANAQAELIDVHGTGAIVGPADCDDPNAPHLPRPAAPTITMPPGVDLPPEKEVVKCLQQDVAYTPELPGVVPVLAASAAECQRLCAATTGCGHFSLSYDRWCHLSPLGATLIKDPSRGVAGPRSCGKQASAPDGSRLFASQDAADAAAAAGLPLWRHLDALLALGATCAAVLGLRLVLVLRPSSYRDLDSVEGEESRGLLNLTEDSRRSLSRSVGWSRLGGNRLRPEFERCATGDDGEDVEMLQDEEDILQ